MVYSMFSAAARTFAARVAAAPRADLFPSSSPAAAALDPNRLIIIDTTLREMKMSGAPH